jgi:hypothetical protein
MELKGLLLTVITFRHRYIVCRDQILEMRLVTHRRDLERPDERGKPLFSSELGPLLDPLDVSETHRRHAIIVPTRRRGIALLVDRIEDIACVSANDIQRLPLFFVRRLERPWFLGVIIDQDRPLLVLDLRQIAQDVLLMQKKPE